jgi:hypothetical protein
MPHLTPAEIVAPHAFGAELIHIVDADTQYCQFALESVEVLKELPDGRWWLLFRRPGLLASFWLIQDVEIVGDGFRFTGNGGHRYEIGPVIEDATESELEWWEQHKPADAAEVRTRQHRFALEALESEPYLSEHLRNP